MEGGKQMNTVTVYLPIKDNGRDIKWSSLVADAKREARTSTAHKDWELEYIDEYHREVPIYNDQGRKVGTEEEAKVIVRKA